MRLGRRDPVHRAAVLKRERELLARLFNPSEEEKREAARFLGAEHHLPDPQAELTLVIHGVDVATDRMEIDISEWKSTR